MAVPEDDLEMTEILEETETGQAEVGIIETKTGVNKCSEKFRFFPTLNLSFRHSSPKKDVVYFLAKMNLMILITSREIRQHSMAENMLGV